MPTVKKVRVNKLLAIAAMAFLVGPAAVWSNPADKGKDKEKDKDISKSHAKLDSNKAAGSPASPAFLTVSATVETAPVPSGEDAADDPAIWVNPADASQSVIIGTDKQGGLALYDLAGKQLQYLPDGKMNNVDNRTGFTLNGQKADVVTAANRTDNSIAIYRIDPATRRLENIAARKITTVEAYGACMYRSAKTGKFYYFVNSKSGVVEQWELFDNGSQKIDAKKVRTFKVGNQTEGCVADDELGHLYIGEEALGIWKYGAEPDASDTRSLVDKAGPGGNLVPDVEGLTIAYGKDGGGYLIASSQGNNSFAIYKRGGNNEYVKSFKIVTGKGIDSVEDTDGIDVTTVSLGPAFPKGILVVQDGINDGGNQNFKFVPLHLIIDL